MRTIQITLKLVITGLVLLAQQALLAQGATCATSTVLCNPNASFPANTSVASLGTIGCLNTTPNPSFFTLNIAQGGDLHLLTTNSAGIDIDFAIWGPFATPNGNCSGNFPTGTIKDCSYSGAANENIDVLGVQAGEFYILLLTNFNGAATNILLDPEPNNTAVLGGPGAILQAGNTFNAAGPYSLVDAPRNLITVPAVTDPNFTGENFTGTGITNATSGTFNPTGLAPGSYPVGLTGTSYSCPVSSNANISVACPTGSASPANNGPLCAGSTLNLTVPAGNAGSTYAWSGPNGFSSATQNPSLTYSAAAAGTYNVTVTASNGCSVSGTTSVSTQAAPSTPVAIDETVCSGNATTTLGVSGASGTINWYDAASAGTLVNTGATYIFTPSATTTYYVDNTVSTCVSARTPVTVTVNALPTPAISASSGLICSGNSTTLTASGGVSYAWSTGATTAAITVSPATSTTYTVTATDANGCTAATFYNVTVTPTPTAPTASGTTICNGFTANLSTATAGTIDWYDAATAGTLLTTGNNYTTPALTTTTTYYVQTTVSACPSARTAVIVTVDPVPATPVAVNETVCDGNATTTYGVSGTTGTVNWYDAASAGTLVNTGTTYSFIPTATTTYYVEQVIAGCLSPRTAVTVTVNPLPTPSITNSASTICSGNTTTLTAIGGATYAWSNGATTAAITVSPATTTTYVVTATTSGCTATASSVINVIATPAAPVVAGTTVCSGFTATLSTATAGTIEWYDAATAGNFVGNGAVLITPALSATTDYYAQTTVNTCPSARSLATVTVIATPSAPVAINDAVCAGNATTTLGVSGTTGTVNWYTEQVGGTLINTGTTYGFTPTATTSFYVDQVANGCTSPRTAVTVTVNALPVPVITTSASTICSGNSATLTANGGTTYVWATGETTAAITVSPATTTTYNVTVTNANGCTATSAATINVTPTPAAPLATGTTICSGFTATLSTATAGAIEWYDAATAGNLVGNGASFTTPVLNATTDYYVQTTVNACTSPRAMVTVTVTPTPSAPVAINDAVCAGNATTTLGVSGTTGTVNWYTEQVGGTLINTGTTYGFTPNATTTFYVEQVANSCTSPRTAVTVTVNALPVPVIASSASTICSGDSATLTASGGTTYVWATGETTAAITVSPATTTMYDVTVTNANGCTATANSRVNVTPTPVAPVANGTTICSGFATTLVALSPGAIEWYDAANAGNLVANGAIFNTPILNATTDYYVETTVNGCTSPRAMVTVTVNPTPSAPVAIDEEVCAGNATTTLGVSGTTGTVNWFTAQTGGTLVNTGTTYIFTPSATTTFYVEQTLNACTSTTRTPVTVTVNALPVPSIAGTSPICSGTSTTLTASGGATYVWATGETTAAITVSPATTTTYIVTATNDKGCTATASFVVTVNPTPATPVISNTGPVCEGSPVIFASSILPDGSYLWTGPNGFTSALQSFTILSTTLADAGVYSVVVSLNGCVSLPGNSTLVVNALPSLPSAPTSNSPLCEHTDLNLNAATVAGLTYEWTGPNGFTSNLASPTITNVNPFDHAGFYNLILTDANACTSLAPYVVIVEVNPQPTNIAVINNGPVCQGEAVVMTAPIIAEASYDWTGPDGFTANTRIATATPAVAGLYNVVVTVAGCNSVPASTDVVVHALPIVNITPDTTVSYNEPVQLVATGGLYYDWTPITFLSNANLPNPVATPPVGITTYTVTAYNEFACSDTASVTITVTDNLSGEFPNLITPNGDGQNDTWVMPFLQQLTSAYTLNIYARGGTLVYSTSAYANDWSGTMNGSNLPDGAYWYVIRTADKEYKGAITVKH